MELLQHYRTFCCRLSLQQLANEENLRKQEESVQKQEAMRRGECSVQLLRVWGHLEPSSWSLCPCCVWCQIGKNRSVPAVLKLLPRLVLEKAALLNICPVILGFPNELSACPDRITEILILHWDNLKQNQFWGGERNITASGRSAWICHLISIQFPVENKAVVWNLLGFFLLLGIARTPGFTELQWSTSLRNVKAICVWVNGIGRPALSTDVDSCAAIQWRKCSLNKTAPVVKPYRIESFYPWISP